MKIIKLTVFGMFAIAAILVKSAWDTYDLARRHPAPHLGIKSDPEALRLKASVRQLSAVIGRRNYRYPRGLASTAAYIRGEFRNAGYNVRAQSYFVHPPGFGELRMENFIATIPAASSGAPVLVIGAHYDTAFETPGADDNASGVAVLLDLARRLKDCSSRVEIRFVAYSTEEPPFFGGPEMGSAVHAQALKAEGRTVLGMVGLEMLGYYDDAKGSQKYPMLLSLFLPNTADYIGVVSNLPSRSFMKEFVNGFRPPQGTRLIAASLPEWVGEITLSDHRNYWDEGFPAVMVTDTAFLRNVHYHQTSDTPEKLDYRRMADVTAGLEHAIRSLVE